jgi:hypothetical protein
MLETLNRIRTIFEETGKAPRFGNGQLLMANERRGLRGVAGAASNSKARITRYRDQAIFFSRLARGERDATFREYWENLARECASSASELEGWMERNRSGRNGRLT